jgi:hypothetical protein
MYFVTDDLMKLNVVNISACVNSTDASSLHHNQSHPHVFVHACREERLFSVKKDRLIYWFQVCVE